MKLACLLALQPADHHAVVPPNPGGAVVHRVLRTRILR